MNQQTFRLAAIISLLALTSCSTDGDLVAHDAWIREAPPAASVMAGYLVIENPGDSPRQLLGATSSAFGRVQLHSTVTEKNRTRMIHERQIDIPPGESVKFKPGDRHLMLTDPVKKVTHGDVVIITLQFDGNEQLDVAFTVRRSVPDRASDD